MAKRAVLLTGASGYIASQLLDAFRDRFELRLVDVASRGRDGEEIADVEVTDLTDPDRSKYAHLFDGADAVVHLGYGRSRQPDEIDRFDAECDNVRMANNVYRAAFDAGVRRVVMASSNHAADFYEHALIHRHEKEMVSTNEIPLSDNFYGWAKAAYELLGFPYASGAFGRKLQVVQVRIGAPREVPGSVYEGRDLAEFKRDLGAHFSRRDLVQLFVKAIETPDIERADGVPWLVVYGISGNTRAFWSLESARRVLGYEPQDDSEVKYAADIARLLTGPDATIGGGRVGG
ncbi:MAG: NAD(P)-dependent oxidoreductase [Gammaproteobacteria bacterium]|nr:NAD(P)-dependent oxidoreductase [Gammaproteobacteria bacterium]